MRKIVIPIVHKQEPRAKFVTENDGYGIWRRQTIAGLVNKSIAVPKIAFPVVWSILYLLMSISLYLILQKSKNNKAIQLYFTQLIFNSLWTLIFFGFKLYFLSFIWILILTIMIVIMIYEFYHLSKIASFINIPYLLWVIFASYLNLTILLLN